MTMARGTKEEKEEKGVHLTPKETFIQIFGHLLEVPRGIGMDPSQKNKGVSHKKSEDPGPRRVPYLVMSFVTS